MTTEEGRNAAQPVLGPLTAAAIFLVVSVNPGGEEAARSLLSQVSQPQRAVGFGYPEGGLSCVAGVASAVWDRLAWPAP
ncbi:Dyp-type peroxidase domain-containing protein [Streptomyces sp. NPDC001100]